MSCRVLFSATGLVLLLALAGFSNATPKLTPEAAELQRKLDHLDANGRATHPDPTPTVMTEQEINAYLASGEMQLPSGVESVKLTGTPGAVSGTAKVNFDEVRAGIHSSNPLLSIFTGTHDVLVETHAYGRGGQGYVHVDSVSLDGIEVPHFVLELFVEKYITPRNPQVGIDSRFKLPDRIDSAVVGQHQVTVIQK